MEDYNVLNDFYLPILNDERTYSSNAFQTLRKNKVDTAELENVTPEVEAGPISAKDVSDADKMEFAKNVGRFFFYDLPRDSLIGIMRGGTNAFQKGMNIGAAIQSKWIDPMGELDNSDIKSMNAKIDEFKTKLDDMQEDSPFVSQMLSIVPQEAMFTVPLYKKFKQMGIPNSYALPMSFGLGSFLSFDKDDSFLVDSSAVKGLKKLIHIAPDTPDDELIDYGTMLLEFTTLGKALDYVVDGVKIGKQYVGNIKPQQAAVATGGGAVAGAVVEETTNAVQDNIANKLISNKTENKKEINILAYLFF